MWHVNQQLADAIRFALFTGMCQGERCGMRWRDVDGAVDGDMDTDGLIHIDNIIKIGLPKPVAFTLATLHLVIH